MSKNRLLSFTQDEEEEEASLPKLKMKQDTRPLSHSDHAAKRIKTSSVSSSTSIGAYSRDALEELRKAQNFLPTNTFIVEEKSAAERVSISSARDLDTCMLREGVELCGDAAEALERIQNEKENESEKDIDAKLVTDKKRERKREKTVAFKDIAVPSKREVMQAAADLQSDVDLEWEREVLSRGTAISSLTSATQSASLSRFASDKESDMEIRDLLETLRTNSFTEKEKVLQIERHIERLQNELSVSHENERRVELQLSGGVERLNVIESLARYFPDLVGMLREKETEIADCKVAIVALVQSMSQHLQRQRCSAQEYFLCRVKKVGELVGIGEYRLVRPLDSLDQESARTNEAESAMFIAQEREIEREKEAELFLQQRWLERDLEKRRARLDEKELDKFFVSMPCLGFDVPVQASCSTDTNERDGIEAAILSSEEEKLITLFARQRLNMFAGRCEREKNMFSLFVQQEVSIYLGTQRTSSKFSISSLVESLSALEDRVSAVFFDVDQSLCEPKVIFALASSLRENQRDSYEAAFVSTSLAQLCEVFVLREILILFLSLLQRCCKPSHHPPSVDLPRIDDLKWLRAILDFEFPENPDQHIMPKIVQGVISPLLQQLISAGMVDFSTPVHVQEFCKICEEVRALASLRHKVFSSSLLGSFTSQCEAMCCAVCKTVPVQEEIQSERGNVDIGLGHAFMFSQCLRACVHLSALISLSPCVENIESGYLVQKIFRERFGPVALKLLKSKEKESRSVAVSLCALAARAISTNNLKNNGWERVRVLLNDWPCRAEDLLSASDLSSISEFCTHVDHDELVRAVEQLL